MSYPPPSYNPYYPQHPAPYQYPPPVQATTPPPPIPPYPSTDNSFQKLPNRFKIIIIVLAVFIVLSVIINLVNYNTRPLNDNSHALRQELGNNKRDLDQEKKLTQDLQDKVSRLKTDKNSSSNKKDEIIEELNKKIKELSAENKQIKESKGENEKIKNLTEENKKLNSQSQESVKKINDLENQLNAAKASTSPSPALQDLQVKLKEQEKKTENSLKELGEANTKLTKIQSESEREKAYLKFIVGERDKLQKTLADRDKKVTNKEPQAAQEQPPLALNPITKEERDQLVAELEKLEETYVYEEDIQYDQVEVQIKTIYNRLREGGLGESRFKKPFSEYFERVMKKRREENEYTLKTIASELWKRKKIKETNLNTFEPKMNAVYRDQLLPKKPFAFEKNVPLLNQICLYTMDRLDKIVFGLKPPPENSEVYDIAIYVCGLAGESFSSTIKDYPNIRFRDEYLKFYEHPESVGMDKLHYYFLCLSTGRIKNLKFVFRPDKLADSAPNFLRIQLERFYLVGLFTNDFSLTQMVKDLLKFCPESVLLTDLPKTLELHLEILLKLDYDLEDPITKEIDYKIINSAKYPFFFDKCLQLYKTLTQKEYPFDRTGEHYKGCLSKNSRSKIVFPDLSSFRKTNMQIDHPSLLFANDSEFLSYTSRNMLRLSLGSSFPLPVSQIPPKKLHSTLLTLLSNDPKFLKWYYSINNSHPLFSFINMSDNILHSVLFENNLTLKEFNSRLQRIPTDLTDENALKILSLLPQGPFPKDLNYFSTYSRELWGKLISMHNDSLLEFLPEKVVNISPEDAKEALAFNRITHYDEELFADFITFDSTFYKFLLFKHLYNKAKFAFPSENLLDSDSFAKSFFIY
jgi:hypothetical protein